MENLHVRCFDSPVELRRSLPFLKLHDAAAVPELAKEGDAGFDLSYCGEDPVSIAPGQRAILGTGIAVALPIGQVGQVCSRSGLAAKNGVAVLNAPGIIDSGYRGELKVILINLGQEEFVATPGMRIAQFLIAPITTPQFAFTQVDSLDETDRGTGGLGSTGT